MAPHLGKAILRAKWRRGWGLMHEGKTAEGCDLLAGIRVNDLSNSGDAEEPDRTAGRILSILGNGGRHFTSWPLENRGGEQGCLGPALHV